MNGHDPCFDFSDGEAEGECCEGSDVQSAGWKVRIVVKFAMVAWKMVED